ncbi:unnamed protein product [Spirodela intermedia]|uniref:Uncharacterized protein n=1 Tax=Spirodela intermedia TaxID=51605 RepID=A0ABN7EBZ1_SPIIN|nr:unnamed protein product [Spirodela intermedia]
MCKTIVDSGSCINAMSDTLISHLILLLINHPRPYHVSWIDSTFISIQSYDEKVLCDVLPLKVSSIILGQLECKPSICLAMIPDHFDDAPTSPSLEVVDLLSEFSTIFSDELLIQLPPIRDIQHAIDLVPVSSLPNFPHYCLDPTQYKELQRQVQELLDKRFIQASLSLCCRSYSLDLEER